MYNILELYQEDGATVFLIILCLCDNFRAVYGKKDGKFWPRLGARKFCPGECSSYMQHHVTDPNFASRDLFPCMGPEQSHYCVQAPCVRRQARSTNFFASRANSPAWIKRPSAQENTLELACIILVYQDPLGIVSPIFAAAWAWEARSAELQSRRLHSFVLAKNSPATSWMCFLQVLFSIQHRYELQGNPRSSFVPPSLGLTLQVNLGGLFSTK